MGAVLDAQGVHFGYRTDRGRRAVLRGVDLRLEPGELVALVGPNGSGKTTLLRVLTGLLPADAGRIALFGRPLAAWRRRELAQRVAVLPQSIELPAGFRVAELVAMARAPHARRLFAESDEDRRAVGLALMEAEAGDLAERLSGELSGGERQRVLVAMALAQQPDLLMLDEPTVHLDLGHAAGVLERVDAMRARRGAAVLAVVHDLSLAAAFATRLAVLHRGAIVAEGRPSDVLRASLIGPVFGARLEEARTPDGRVVLVPAARRASAVMNLSGDRRL